MSDDKEMDFTNLMDLAGEDVSDVQAITSTLQPEGLYIVDVLQVTMQEGTVTTQDGDKQVGNIRVEGLIVDYRPLKEVEDGPIREMEGKSYNEFHTIWLGSKEEVLEGIGKLKGRWQTARFPTSGALGGIEGTSGWLDGIVGQRVAIRVQHKTDRQGNARAYRDWLDPKGMKKYDMDWEDLQRPALTPEGEEIDEADLEKPLSKIKK